MLHPSPMKTHRLILSLSALALLSACNNATLNQWVDPDRTFSVLPQPDVKGVNDTQEEGAKAALAAGDFAKAAQIYEQLATSAKTSPEQLLRYKIGWASSLRRLGDYDRALAMFSELVEQNAKNMDVAEGKALTLMAMGKTVDASRAFSDIMEAEPNRWRTLNALGILFVTKNMIPEAMAYYTEGLKFSPDNPAILNNVGLTMAIDKNYGRATDALDQASRLSKTPGQRKQIDMNMAMVLGVSGDLDHAREIAARYLEGPALDNNMGLYAHLAKDDGLAKTYLNMALSQSPTFYERAWTNLDALNENARSPDAPKPEPTPNLPKMKK